MEQLNKFYLSSILKNQTYFVPIMVLFFQDLGLSYSEIFWVFTIGSVFSFIIEIPTGVIADLYGKKKSLIFSKLLIFASFIFFGLSDSFLELVLSNLVMVLGQGFRSGTEVGYIYDYLKTDKTLPSYTHVKNRQKIYARISEALAALIGGYIAVELGFSMVFFIASLPAFLNLLQTFSWEDDLGTEKKNSFNYAMSRAHVKKSIAETRKNPQILSLMINIMIFSSSFFAIEKFIQPYMKDIGVNLEYFGIIYSGMLIASALVVKISDHLEAWLGGRRLSNYLSLAAFIPLIIIGLGFRSYIGIAFLFAILIVENIRSTVVNSVFHDMIGSENRSTMGSILELFRSTGKLVLLPLAGFFADAFSIYISILILSFVVLANGLFFWIRKTTK